MRRLLNFIFALMLALGTGGVELRSEGRQPCSCCETALPAEPCGCGMPQQSSSQRCGGNQTPISAALARPASAPAEVRTADQSVCGEAAPCPRELSAQIQAGREPQIGWRTFAPGEGPPITAAERMALLSTYRI